MFGMEHLLFQNKKSLPFGLVALCAILGGGVGIEYLPLHGIVLKTHLNNLNHVQPTVFN